MKRITVNIHTGDNFIHGINALLRSERSFVKLKDLLFTGGRHTRYTVKVMYGSLNCNHFYQVILREERFRKQNTSTNV